MKRLTGVGVPALAVLLALVATHAAAGPRATLVDPSPTMKILVNKDGWYRVPRASLEGQGFVFPVDDRRLLHLTTGGQEVPFQVRSDNLEFYGQGLDALHTDTRVYWLSVGTAPGQAMEFVRARAPSTTPGSSFPATLTVEERISYSLTVINGAKSNFFGASVRSARVCASASPATKILTVPHVDTSQPSSLRIDVQALTEGAAYTIDASVNSASQSPPLTGFGDVAMTRTYDTTGLLMNGSNTVVLSDNQPAPPATPQNSCPPARIVRTDTYVVSYQHLPLAESDKLWFPGVAGQAQSIDGFSSNRVRLLDITNPVQPRELLPSIRQTSGDYTIDVTPPNGASRLYAFNDDTTVLSPKAIVRDIPSDLRSPRDVDLVVISHKNFISNIQPLVNLRMSEGLQVAVADIEDVYDEFNFGNKDPNAIKEFLRNAKNTWLSGGPTYALFVGDATNDPRNRTGVGDLDFVPTNLVDATFTEAPADDSLTDFDDDGDPELGVGRLPARTTAELDHMVTKIINYNNLTPAPARSAVLVSDNFDRGDYHFDQFSDDLKTTLIAGGVSPGSITSIYRPDMATSASDTATHNAIMSAASNNPTIVNWFGHGAFQSWAGSPPLLQVPDAPLLTNTGLLSLYLMMTCQNGYFIGTNFQGLGEALLLRADPPPLTPNGAVAVWGSSGDTVPFDQVNAAKTALTTLLTNPNARLGDAMVAAKAAISDIDVKHTWILLGDPTTKLK